MKKCPVCKRIIEQKELGIYKCLCGFTQVTAMEKYKSKWIKEENIKIETDRYYSQEEVRHEVVKLTYIPTGDNTTFDSVTSQVYAYNRALELLEKKIFNNINKIINGND